MAHLRNGAEHTGKMPGGQDGEIPKADERSCLESAPVIIGMGQLNDVVETGHLLVELAADTANKPVAKRGHPAKENDRAGFAATISLRQRRKCDVALGHSGFRSAAVYSGSSSP